MIPSLEVWPTKAKEAPSRLEVRLAPQDTNPVFQCLWELFNYLKKGLISHAFLNFKT